MKLLFLSALSVLMAALWVAPAQAQSVTYRPNFLLSDLSALGPNGGTIDVTYERVGSPADSPHGASFTVSLTFSDLTPTVGGDHLSYTGFYVGMSGIAFQFDPSNIVAGDLPHLPLGSTESVIEMDPPGTYLNPNPGMAYTYEVTAGNVPSASGWTYTQSEALSGGTGSGSGGFPGGASFFYATVFGGDRTYINDGGASWEFGTTLDVGLMYFVEGPISDAEITSYFSSQAPAGFAGTTGFGFPDLIFTPVPEPSGALLVMASGVALLIRRRSRRR